MRHNVIIYNDPRQLGEALWEDVISKNIYAGIKKESERDFSALYQQNPTIETGNMFKRDKFKYYTYINGVIKADKDYTLQDFNIYQTVDPAGTKGITSDYFVVLTFGINKHNGDIIVLDISREKAETPDHLDILNREYVKWNPMSQYVESEKWGLSIIQAFKRTNRPVQELKAKGDKPTRAKLVQGYYENGKIWHRQGASWLLDFEDEVLKFPFAPHDDMVDCIAYAAIVTQSMSTQFQFLRIGADGVKR